MTPEEARDALDPEPKGGPWLWINPDAVDTPEVKPGDHVTFEAFGWKILGTVTRWDEDGFTIEEVKNDAPTRPTLAGMTPDERAACRGMQADLAGGDRVVILDGTPDHDGFVHVLERTLDVYHASPEDVTPRPDLPRFEWPANRTPRAVADQAVAEGSVWGDAEELPDFLALGIEALAQSPEGRAAMRQIVHGQMADICNLFGLDYPEGEADD